MGAQVFASRAQQLGTNDLDAARRQSLERLPIGRLGTVTDIAKGIVFLASDDAGFMTGAGLVVDGGTCSWSTMVVSAGSAASPSVVAHSTSASARTKGRAAPGQPLTRSFQITAAISTICVHDLFS